MGDLSAKMPSKWISNHSTAVTDADIDTHYRKVFVQDQDLTEFCILSLQY